MYLDLKEIRQETHDLIKKEIRTINNFFFLKNYFIIMRNCLIEAYIKIYIHIYIYLVD